MVIKRLMRAINNTSATIATMLPRGKIACNTMKERILEKSLFNAAFARLSLPQSQVLWYMRNSITWVASKNGTNVQNAIFVPTTPPNWSFMNEFIRGKSHSNVANAIMPALERLSLLDMSGFTATQNSTNAIFVILNADLKLGWKATV